MQFPTLLWTRFSQYSLLSFYQSLSILCPLDNLRNRIISVILFEPWVIDVIILNSNTLRTIHNIKRLHSKDQKTTQILSSKGTRQIIRNPSHLPVSQSLNGHEWARLMRHVNVVIRQNGAFFKLVFWRSIMSLFKLPLNANYSLNDYAVTFVYLI